MPRISHQEFRDELDRLSSSPNAVPYDVQDGGTLAPSSRIPPATNPSTRRPARPRQSTPDPIGLAGSAIDAVCIPYSLAPRTVSNFLRRVPVNAAANAIWPNATDNILQRVCPASPSFEPPSPEQQFEGGQCDGVLYRVTVNSTSHNSSCAPAINRTDGGDFWGPITGVRAVKANPNNPNSSLFNIEVSCRGRRGDAPGNIREERLTFIQNSVSGCPDPFITNVTVAPEDGSADVCGNQPPSYVGDSIINFSPTLDIDIGNNAPVSISPTFETNIDGSIEIGLPGIGDITIDIGGIDINFGDGGANPPQPAPDPSPPRPDPDDTSPEPGDPPPSPPDEDDPATEEPPEQPEEVIRAVLVTVSAVPGGIGTLYQEGNPDISIPNLGYVNFRCRVDGQSSGWTDDQPVKNRRHMIVCPWEGGAFDVKGTPRPGVQWTLTPLYSVSSLPVVE